ncbi:MAG: LamG-like jellyroll fold domain-containing protein [Armatimonadota bacterium]
MKFSWIVIAVCAIISIINPAFCTDVAPQDNWAEIACMGSGFVVWESSRTGDWRIWRCNLDGSDLRQLSPEEKGRDHYCPHLSPDGKRLVYISYPKDKDGYKAHSKDILLPMHLLSTDGRFDRVIIPSARAYGEDRAVFWIDDNRFIYIDGDGTTCEFDIAANKSTPITSQTRDEYGWLINAQKTFAVPGWPTSFNPFDSGTGKITMGNELRGCQPYISSDGIWGYWMGGGGGPINRYNLATGKASPILGKGDGRMPSDRSYLYFPMLSHNMRLLAFAASPNQHDHFNSDYDIFIAKIDPQTLEIIGKPVRYSFDPACDRFPDVYVDEMSLGSFKGESPYTVKFNAPKDSAPDCRWNFGDGTSAAGKSQSHTYKTPGRYTVELQQGNTVIRGLVTVESAKSPEVVSAALRGGNQIVITFNEPVSIEKAKLSLKSKQKINKTTLDKDKLNLIVLLAGNIAKEDYLSIEGIYDLAQSPNAMTKKVAKIEPHLWPSDRKNMVFLWENGSKGCMMGSGEQCTVKANGPAAFDSNYAMRLMGGSFMTTGLDDYLLKACKSTNQLTIEATLKVDNIEQQGPSRIISFSSDPSNRNFTLGQSQNRLILRLRTPSTGNNGIEPEVSIGTIPAGKRVHVIVSYSPGELSCYIDGKRVLKTDQVKGDFSNWSPQHFIIGDEWSGERLWRGTLEGVAIYNRVFTPDEARHNYESYMALNSRSDLPVIRVKAQMTAASKTPTLDEIRPYKEALVLNEYTVQKVIQGECKSQKIRVAHWAILGGVNVLKINPKTKTPVDLVLEPFLKNPQLESIYMSDSLEIDPDIPIYYDVSL